MLNEKPNITYLWKFTTRLCSVMADDVNNNAHLFNVKKYRGNLLRFIFHYKNV